MKILERGSSGSSDQSLTAANCGKGLGSRSMVQVIPASRASSEVKKQRLGEKRNKFMNFAGVLRHILDQPRIGTSNYDLKPQYHFVSRGSIMNHIIRLKILNLTQKNIAVHVLPRRSVRSW
jgi:hypothetical protein